MKNENKEKINQTSVTKQAQDFLNQIEQIIEEKLKKISRTESAIVFKTNNDGTVDVYLPPNKKSIFTKIQNQTKYDLKVGDSVEIYLKNGSFSNCWIIAKHSR